MNTGNSIYKTFEALRDGDLAKAKDGLQEAWDAFKEYETRHNENLARERKLRDDEKVSRPHSKIARAIQIAADVHERQVDKAEQPYILHSLAVMQMAGEMADVARFGGTDTKENVLIAGVLHDVIEDFDGSPQEALNLRSMIRSEFGDDVFVALMALTKSKGQPYDDYIEGVAKNSIARFVKIADLTHNMDTGRLPEDKIGEKDYQRWDKYRRALVRLKRGD